MAFNNPTWLASCTSILAAPEARRTWPASELSRRRQAIALTAGTMCTARQAPSLVAFTQCLNLDPWNNVMVSRIRGPAPYCAELEPLVHLWILRNLVPLGGIGALLHHILTSTSEAFRWRPVCLSQCLDRCLDGRCNCAGKYRSPREARPRPGARARHSIPKLVARIPPVHLISLDPACIRMVHARKNDLTGDIDSRHILSHKPRTMFSHHRRTACDAAAMNSSP